MSKSSDPAKSPKDAEKTASVAAKVPESKEDKGAKAPAELPAMDERRLSFSELREYKSLLSADALGPLFSDGLATVRANAATACAVLGETPPSLFMLLRDNESRVALTAADTIDKLHLKLLDHLPAIVGRLDGATAEVRDQVVQTLTKYVGKNDEALALALDVGEDLALKTVVEACARTGNAGIQFLLDATRHKRDRIRVNAVSGLDRIADKASMRKVIDRFEDMIENDPIPDIRRVAHLAAQHVFERLNEEQVSDPLPKNIPDFEERTLSASELKEYVDALTIGQIVAALEDGRKHVRINGARLLMQKGPSGAEAADSLALLLRDIVAQVRRAAALAFAKIDDGAEAAADTLVLACGDEVQDIAESAADALRARGAKVQDALVRGLEAGDVAHGERIAKLVSLLPDAPTLLAASFQSASVNVQVNSARGLALLGRKRAAGALDLLRDARTGGDARTRSAVFDALAILDPQAEGPPPVKLKGFEDTFMSAEELAKVAGRLRIDSLTVALGDGRDMVRANAATGLGVLGEKAASTVAQLAARTRDNSAAVRLASLQAIGAMGPAIFEVSDAVVAALGDEDSGVVSAASDLITKTGPRFIGPLIRGLETDQRGHAENINRIIGKYPDAMEILCDAFESAAVNIQVNAALGLGMLGRERVGRGLQLLEGARTGGWQQTRVAVFEALEMLAPREQGPPPIRVAGFETKLLGADAFDAASLRVDSLLAVISDGREIVRANTATALGVLGTVDESTIRPLGVLMRDNDAAVRAAAATTLGKFGEKALAVSDDLVGALGDSNAQVLDAVRAALAVHKTKVLGALLRGLDIDDRTHADNILRLIVALPDASQNLCDAFESPAVNVQVNAARGLGMLGKRQIGPGLAILEGARTGGDARTREAVFEALAMLDA